MASREKKLSTGRKQASASPVPLKENVVVSEHTKQATKTDLPAPAEDVSSKPAAKTTTQKNSALKTDTGKRPATLAKKVTKNVAKKPLTKTISLNLKAKNKRPGKIKHALAKVLLQNAKNKMEGKPAILIKNGIKPKKISKKKVQPDAKQNEGSPVLEFTPPLEHTDKKVVKKKVKKIPVSSPDENIKKLKKQSSLTSIDDTINSILNKIIAEEEAKKCTKKRNRKPKTETPLDTTSETIEDVIKDLSSLIKSETFKEETNSLQPGKTEIIKPKKSNSKKSKSDVKKKSIKKENIENHFNKRITIDASARQLIDMLDLSVQRNKNFSSPIISRRHSIEKFHIDTLDNSDPFNSALSALPRSVTPRSKRISKIRQSAESRCPVKRFSPYTTRSDVPIQILRNGKHRKVKESTLLDGLDNVIKKRKRLCSDLSGSEKSVSKLSGYESDSSFSDKTSLCGPDNFDHKEGSVKNEIVKKEDGDARNQPLEHSINIKSLQTKLVEAVKRSLSTEMALSNAESSLKNEHSNFMDSNSNLCSDVKSEDSSNKCVGSETDFSTAVTPSAKVPEKSIILDIMKQAFNDINSDDQEKRTTRSSSKKGTKSEEEKIGETTPVSTNKFYGIKSPCDENIVLAKESEISNKVDCQNVQVSSVALCQNVQVSSDALKEIDAMEIEDSGAFSDLTESKVNNCQTVLEVTENEANISSEKVDCQAIEETPEDLAIKENILQALGLQSLKAAEQSKLKGKPFKNDYTGTLKTVIKLNRCEKKKGGRTTMKLTLQKIKSRAPKEVDAEFTRTEEEQGQKHFKEASSSWKSHAAQSSDTADGSSEHTSDGDTLATEGDDSGKILVIPEKASSFSIHPDRLCKDECSYCFGKFGLFDTPCHIAQMKSVERQDKILATEKHLTSDSCLCDACYRHVDRKSNAPSYLNKLNKRTNIVAPGPRQDHCHVLGCSNIATNILRRKWLIKMKKSVCQVINIDLDNPGLHSIPLCDEHYLSLEHLMICAMCKRRLARNHIHYLGPEANDLNIALNVEGIPVKLSDKPLVCKICRYFASLIMKPAEDRPENAQVFFKEYKKRLLHFHDIEVMDDAAAEEPIRIPTKEKSEKELLKKKKKLNKNENSDPPQIEIEKNDQLRVPSDSTSTSKSRSESPSDYMIDYNTLIPNIAIECSNDLDSAKRDHHKLLLSKKSTHNDCIIREAVEISKSMRYRNSGYSNLSKNSAIAVQRLGSNPCISVRQLFPGEEELGLQANIEFNHLKEKTPEGWEKCISTIQYDMDTKLLWNELQKPYGNQSSFLRHLILLEKYFRSGDLILSPNASHHSINYSESVQNRLHAYDNIPSSIYNSHLPSASANLTTSTTISTISANSTQAQQNLKKSSSGIITTKEAIPNVSLINTANIPKSTPITVSQINSLTPGTVSKTKNSTPPGLISLNPSPSRGTSLVKVSQPQKIKIPLTKNWRPTLIPIDPNKKHDKIPGYVKVISGSKPYHITVDDYNRMCAIKKSYDLKQKRLMEAQAGNSASTQSVSNHSLLKSIVPRKGLTISKTATVTSPKSDNSLSDGTEIENSLEKLDRTVENLESKLTASTSIINLPKIPKSLTVIPQTVTQKSSGLSSPMIPSKPKPSVTKS